MLSGAALRGVNIFSPVSLILTDKSNIAQRFKKQATQGTGHMFLRPALLCSGIIATAGNRKSKRCAPGGRTDKEQAR